MRGILAVSALLGLMVMGLAMDNGIEMDESWEKLDGTTFVNRDTGELYQPEAGEHYQGDIVLPKDDGHGKRNTAWSFTKWTNGIVPYSYHRFWAEDKYFKGKIRQSMDYIEERTCVRFVPRNNERNWITLVRKKGCWSHIGVSTPGQELSIGGGCLQIGVVMHEFLHALGFKHEHERNDREGIISVNITNVQSSYRQWFYPHNFKVTTPYDVDSIMHYGRYAFALTKQYDVITQLSNFQDGTIGQRDHLSRSDIKEINDLYNCANVHRPLTKTPLNAEGEVVVNCHFAQGSYCGMSAQKGSIERWSVIQDGRWGNSAKFTVGSHEVNNFQRIGFLFVEWLTPGQQYCISVGYKIVNAGELSIKMNRQELSGRAGRTNGWQTLRGQINASSPSKYRNEVYILASIRGNEYGDIQIDEVILRRGRC